MALINILVAVNAEQLVQQVTSGGMSAGAEDAPAQLNKDVFITMISQYSSYMLNENSVFMSGLTIAANPGDTIQWSITTFGNNTDYTPFLYGAYFNPSEAVYPMTYLNKEVSQYFPVSSGKLTQYSNNVYVAQSVVAGSAPGMQVTFSFQLINNANGNSVGFFTWDPFISIN